jgi:hypothetical protein
MCVHTKRCMKQVSTCRETTSTHEGNFKEDERNIDDGTFP